MRSLIISVAFFLLSISVYGQTSRGTITGTIIDTAGASITEAKIEIINLTTGVKRNTTSSDRGMYRFDGVDLGTYTLNVTRTGFKLYSAKDIQTDANRTVTLNPTLEVGNIANSVEMIASTADMLAKDSPIRGGNISARAITFLPVSGLEPISLARILPGVTRLSGGSTFGNGGNNTQFSVNGSRPRGNNYLIDGTENNDISLGGNAQSFNMLDAVQEVSVQTSNYSAEFGRAGGGIFNVVTKSGSNNYHGTGFWQYRSQLFEANNNLTALTGQRKAIFHENIFGGTVGGPIKKNKTFFFGSIQDDILPGNYQNIFSMPTQAGVDAMKGAFPNSSNLNRYLSTLGNFRGNTNFQQIDMGNRRGSAQFGDYAFNVSNTVKQLQWMARIDHNISEKNQLSFRYIMDHSPSRINSITFPGFGSDIKVRNQNFLFSDVWILSPTYTNEFRFSYGQLAFDYPITSQSNNEASTLPYVFIAGISSATGSYLGVATSFPQFRFANNWLLQETQTKVVGNHTFRYGLELLKQSAKQRPPFIERGALIYFASPGFTGLANFLDDFGGDSGAATKNFGSPVYYPDAFRHSYFAQDIWKLKRSLTMTLGLRYENFGQPANNSFKYPAFTGFGTLQDMLTPNKVNVDSNNFGPTIGVAWSPSYKSGILGRLFGDDRSVWRVGYQISYDSFFNNMLSNMAAGTPNTISTSINASAKGATPRGLANLSGLLPTSAGAVTLKNDVTTLFEPNIRNPYTQRWSFGFQRELPRKMLLDVSYVGTGSHRLFVTKDLNPGTTSNRIFNDYGIRTVRSSEGNSNYNSLQAKLDKRFGNRVDFTAAYTFSKNMDSVSEIIATTSNSSFNSMPIMFGGSALDHAVSDLQRAHVLTFTYSLEIPGPKHGILSVPLGGWSVTGITTFQSGQPYSVLNGAGGDRNGDGINNDRPDIGNPNATINTRAKVVKLSQCSTGLLNPDSNNCINRNDIRFVQGIGLPNASTVGRNTLYTSGVNNFDLDIIKRFNIIEGKILEYRLEAFNLFNHPQFVNVSNRDVITAPAGRFLNPNFTDAGRRTMRMQLKLIF